MQTTQSETKRGNRKNEVLILNAEKLASIDSLFGATYPQASFNTAWKKILFNQFHDILPGSGIGINYVDAARKYAETSRFSNDTIHDALSDIAARVKSDGVSVLVFNPLSWPRTEEVEFEVQFPNLPSHLRVMYRDTNASPEKMWLRSEIVNSDPSTGKVKLRILATDIPPLGYKLIELQATSPRIDLDNIQTEGKSAHTTGPLLLGTATSLENEFLKLSIDPKTGCMTSLFDKRNNTEALAPAVQGVGAPSNLYPSKGSEPLPCGNQLQAFVDKPKKWDAWNVDADFIEHHTDLMQAEEVKLVENSPLQRRRFACATSGRTRSSSRTSRCILACRASMYTCRLTGTRSTSC